MFRYDVDYIVNVSIINGLPRNNAIFAIFSCYYCFAALRLFSAIFHRLNNKTVSLLLHAATIKRCAALFLASACRFVRQHFILFYFIPKLQLIAPLFQRAERDAQIPGEKERG